uniref:Uncharacterized protein n=1 Tax=Rhizophora mucronata TaxID=61149 RepID=A0A2P2QS98_RHIMU
MLNSLVWLLILFIALVLI